MNHSKSPYEQFFADYKNTALSGKTIYGLADFSFFGFFGRQTKFAPLGIYFCTESIIDLVSTLDLSKDKSNQKIIDLLRFDYKLIDKEAIIIAGALRRLYRFALSGKQKSTLIVSGKDKNVEGGDVTNLVDDIFVLFASSQIHTGTADKIFDFLASQKWDTNNDPIVEKIAQNTIEYYLKNDRHPALDYHGEKFIRYKILELAKRNDHAEENKDCMSTLQK
jgi:hypothetical protein